VTVPGVLAGSIPQKVQDSQNCGAGFIYSAMDFVHNSRWKIVVARNGSRRASRTVSRGTTTVK
jgi:hypothetical protein